MTFKEDGMWYHANIQEIPGNISRNTIKCFILSKTWIEYIIPVCELCSILISI